jgi:hypothetical protein
LNEIVNRKCFVLLLIKIFFINNAAVRMDIIDQHFIHFGDFFELLTYGIMVSISIAAIKSHHAMR